MRDPHAVRRAALTAGCLVVPLAVLCVLVVTEFRPLMRFDVFVVREWHDAVVDTGWRTFFLRVAEYSGSRVTFTLLIVVALCFAAGRHVRTAAWVVFVALLTPAAWGLGKQLVERERPDVADQIGGFSFPSGHATGISAAMGVLVVLTAGSSLRPKLRVGVIVGCVVVALLVGLDRVFLGAHHPSDVAAGWLLGILIVVVTGTLFGVMHTDTAAGPEPAGLSSRVELRSTLAVILNPIKVDDADGFKVRVGLALRAAGWDEPLWFETTVDDAGASMARAAVAAGADVVVVAGGDGTVRVVCAEMAGSGIPVGVIPAGTGNLLARNLGIPLAHDQALDIVLRGQDRAIDVVSIHGDNLPETRFVVMAGLGLDAAIMDGAPDALKARLGWPAYVVAGARHLRYPAVNVDISIDGGEPVQRRARTVVIGNVGSLQAGIPLLPDAKIDDGVLDVVVIAPRRLFGWLSVVMRVLARGRRTDETLDRFTGRSVALTAHHASPRQLDGDTVGMGTELQAEIQPGLLLVRVPR